MITSAREAYIALNMIPNVGPVRVRQLLETFGTADAILRATRSDLLRIHGIGESISEAIATWQDTLDLSAELKRIAEFGCSVVCLDDPDYPPLLKQLYDPPLVLYVKGTLTERDRQCVAIVGSRRTTHYGVSTARRLAHQLANVGVTVVSGGARGIDTAAHQGALSAKGRTIAVLGTGINIVFPVENAALFEQISQNGAVITQFPFNRPADKQSFPIRNRIVAGMTLGSVVVEANLTSGALITANMAVDFGRQVFAVPGHIDSPQSKGCHDLIKKGAKLCEGVEDILTEFEYAFPASNRPNDVEARQQSLVLEFSEKETVILQAIGNQQLGVDDIIQASGLAASVVSVTLLGLEMKRVLKQQPGRVYCKAG